MNADLVYKLMLETQTDSKNDVKAAPSKLSEAAKKGIEQAKKENIEEMFKGLKKDLSAPMIGLLDSEVRALPTSYSLKQYVRARESQGGVGSCTAWGTTGVIETKYRIEKGVELNLSESYLWLMQKEQPNAWASATTAAKFWAVRSEFWGYYAKEGKPGWQNAKVCAPQNPRELSNLEQMKLEISQNNPVCFSFSADFNNFAANGWVDHTKTKTNGAHEVFVVAYTDDARFPGGGFFECANSWGNTHGNKGYFYVPYAYVLEGKFWVNFIAFSKALLHKDAAPVPPPKPVATYDVSCECKLIKKFVPSGSKTLHYQFDWKIVGPDAGTVAQVEESAQIKKWALGRTLKDVKAVDMKLEAKEYLNTYADNWCPGVLNVTFVDGVKKEIALVFPNVE